MVLDLSSLKYESSKCMLSGRVFMNEKYQKYLLRQYSIISEGRNMDDNYDIVIIGAGPAGLFCAYDLINRTNSKILIIDKGHDINERYCAVNQKHECVNCNPCNIVSGIGGSGFLFDSKLCLSENVGELLQRHFRECKFDRSLVRYIDRLLPDNGNIKRISNKNLQKLNNSLSDIGLNLEYYPVRGFTRGKEIVENLRLFFYQNGIDVFPRTEAITFNKDVNGKFNITTMHNGNYKKINSKYLVVSPGKSGVKWLSEQSYLIGLNTEKNPLYIGIRIEVKKHILKKITNVSHNPKITKFIGKYYTKTHCFCEGGVVSKCKYDDAFLVDGHPKFEEDLDNTNFTIFVKLNTPSEVDSTFGFANNILSKFINNDKRNVILQRLGDLRNNTPSTKMGIKKNSIRPSLSDYEFKDINQFLPKEIIHTCISFLEDLNKICPGINDNSTLIYAPVVEWWGDRISVNREMETNLENLFVIGDGSGWTQGIIAASATGLIASDSIVEKLKLKELQIQDQMNLIQNPLQIICNPL